MLQVVGRHQTLGKIIVVVALSPVLSIHAWSLMLKN